jgi:hypothetical protein
LQLVESHALTAFFLGGLTGRRKRLLLDFISLIELIAAPTDAVSSLRGLLVVHK